MYSNKLTVAIKAGGKVLREFNNDIVYVPFGSEYTILIKNLNTVRAQVRIQIDGTDATENTCLVINPNSEIEIERFIKNGNLGQGNRFKFIERTAAIENGPRGIKVDDSLIRIEFQFEQMYTKPSNDWLLVAQTDRRIKSAIATADAVNQFNVSSQANFIAPQATAVSYSTGITVPGSVSNQQFNHTQSFTTEATKHAMVINLMGEMPNGALVAKAVTVKSKPKCTTCGHTNKANSKFCSQCGTSLVIV